jgi:hypothetical protein
MELAFGIIIGMTIVGVPSMMIVYKKIRSVQYLKAVLADIDNKAAYLLKVQEQNRMAYKKLAQEVEAITKRSNN